MSSSNLSLEERIRKYNEPGRRASDGGYLFTDEAQISHQRGMVWDFVKSVGSTLLEGRDLVNISMPVYIFEPRSYLQRLPDLWSYLNLLHASADATDPLTRMKYIVVFALSGLSCTCVQRKPFNPILGETYEATFEDGTEIFAEQSSHHPPISHFVVKPQSKKFLLTGYAGWNASVRGNSLKATQKGPNRVTYSDGTVIEWEMPPLNLSGIMIGRRVLNFVDTVTFTDNRNKLRCVATFNPNSVGFIASLFTKRTSTTDTIKADIFQIGETGGNGELLGTIDGSWLSHLDFCPAGSDTKERMWSIESEERMRPIPATNPLPSDCRYRQDLICLMADDVNGAQEWKVKLEEKQRREAKLRKQYSADH